VLSEPSSIFLSKAVQKKGNDKWQKQQSECKDTETTLQGGSISTS